MKIKIYIKAITTIFLWGVSFLWSDKLLGLGVSVEYFIFIRIFLAGLLLFALNKVMGYDMRVSRSDFFKLILLALCEPFLYYICESYGIEFSGSPTYSSLIIATNPIFSILAGVLIFKEKITPVNVIGALVCLGGVALVTITSSSVGKYFIIGLVLLILAVLAEVGLASFTKAIKGDYKPQVIVMYEFLLGSLFLLPLFLTKGIKSFDPAVYLSWNVISPILCLSVFCSVIAFCLWVDSVRGLGVAKSGVFQAMNPVVTAVVGTIIGQEHLNPLQWIGIAVALVGIIFSQTETFKRKV